MKPIFKCHIFNQDYYCIAGICDECPKLMVLPNQNVHHPYDRDCTAAEHVQLL